MLPKRLTKFIEEEVPKQVEDDPTSKRLSSRNGADVEEALELLPMASQRGSRNADGDYLTLLLGSSILSGGSRHITYVELHRSILFEICSTLYYIKTFFLKLYSAPFMHT